MPRTAITLTTGYVFMAVAMTLAWQMRKSFSNRCDDQFSFLFYFADLQLIKTESSTKYRNKNDSARKKRSKILKQVEKVVVSIPFDSIWIWISTAAATYTHTRTHIMKTWPQPNSINWVSATIASAATATPSSHDWLHMPQEREVIFDRMMWYFHLNDLYIK